uniref:Uncharacterized protein n=1 Tax=Arundo donax TaxID=35708 RepID=A0A0A9HSI3_ARUDO
MPIATSNLLFLHSPSIMILQLAVSKLYPFSLILSNNHSASMVLPALHRLCSRTLYVNKLGAHPFSAISSKILLAAAMLPFEQ